MHTRTPRLAALLVLLAPATLAAAEPADPYARGKQMLDTYFRKQVDAIADACLADLTTKADWEKRRPELRRQFLDMIGLWPLPPRTDLKVTITGTVETPRFTVEKLHFQSMPGLYVTANLYLPRPAPKKAPTILYVCGHGNTVENGVSFGSKVSYQRHGASFAERGYVCMVLDTLELAEIKGEHHGTSRQGMWWWQTLGYTPAGVECWNAMRALDYLETRPEVDPKRFGVTGRSGGGATTWWLAAADDRPQCIVPVAGIADLRAHVLEGYPGRLQTGVIAGHCDCMYFVNTYRWDFPLVVALCAPRPLLLGNSDADDIFPVPGYRRIAEKARRVYDLYGAGAKFELLETKGPHKDTPELRTGAARWMNRWLKNEPAVVPDDEPMKLKPAQLKVFAKLPDDSLNASIHETFVKSAHPDVPESAEVAREWWKGKRPQWERFLKEKVFGGWPATAQALNAKPAGDVTKDGMRLRAFDFTSEAGVDLRVWLLTAAKVEKPKLVVLTAVDEPEWAEWCGGLGPDFAAVLQLAKPPKRDDARFERDRRVLEKQGWAFAVVAPRGIGPTRWAAEDGKGTDLQIRRRFALLGQTLDGQRVWDVRRGLAVLRGVAELKGVPLWLQGKRDVAGVVLYASLFEPDVPRLDLWHLPASHRTGPIFLNVRRQLDLPQAVAMALPREIKLYVEDDAEAKRWEWPLRLQKALGEKKLQVRKVGE